MQNVGIHVYSIFIHSHFVALYYIVFTFGIFFERISLSLYPLPRLASFLFPYFVILQNIFIILFIKIFNKQLISIKSDCKSKATTTAKNPIKWSLCISSYSSSFHALSYISFPTICHRLIEISSRLFSFTFFF